MVPVSPSTLQWPTSHTCTGTLPCSPRHTTPHCTTRVKQQQQQQQLTESLLSIIRMNKSDQFPFLSLHSVVDTAIMSCHVMSCHIILLHPILFYSSLVHLVFLCMFECHLLGSLPCLVYRCAARPCRTDSIINTALHCAVEPQSLP